MTVVVSAGTSEDVPAAVRVFAAGEATRRGSPVTAAEQASITTRLTDGGAWLLVAREGDEVVGIAAGFDARTDDGHGPDVVPGLAHLSLVFIEPSRWGRGIGAAVLDAVLAEARRRGYERIQLWTHEDNTRAQRLYTSRGFAPVGRTKVDDRGAELIGLWVRDLRPRASRGR